MNKTKIIPILLVSLFSIILISELASAAEPFKIVSAKWLPSGKQNETIAFGEEIDFSVSVPYNRAMRGCYLMKARVSVTLYEKDSRQLVYSFLDEKLLTREEINKGFFANYHINQNVYDNIGKYYVEVYKTESWLLCWYGTDAVKELLTYRIYLDVQEAEEPTQVIPIPILSEPTTEVNENSVYSYQAVSMAKNGGTLRYTLTQAPSWISISQSGLVGGTAPEVNSNTEYSIVIKVSEMVPSTVSSTGGLQEITSSTQHYTLTVKDTDSPEPIDYYSCQQDSDCIKVQAGCCNCNYGGTLTSINKIYLGGWMNKLQFMCHNVACPSVISNHWTCTNSQAKCTSGKCELVPANINPVCGNDICESGENATSCPADCEIIIPPVCGNDICESGENATSCPADCEIIIPPICGNKICETGESITCPLDCINPRPECGDGICQAGENCDPDCRPEDDDDDNENDYLYKDVYETGYLQFSDARKAAKTITLVEPEYVKPKRSFWAIFWEELVEFFRNLF